MNEIELTLSEKAKLEVNHKSSKDVYERDRIKAILLRSEGWSVSAISQALRLHDSTVNTHLKEYLKSQKLKPTRGGSESILSSPQSEELIAHLTDTTYQSTHQIILYIKATYDVTYSVPGLNKWFHRNGFSFKKAKGIPHKADLEKQVEFIKKYKRLKKRLKADEKLLFIDGVHPTQATKLSYGWIRTGQNKLIKTSASRTRVNILGAISLENPEEVITESYETINAESMISFLKKLRAEHSSYKKIHVILDQAGYNKAHDLFREAKKLNIKLHHLPAYSPNLNPIERLWKFMNEKVRNNRFFKSAKDFREAINDFLKNDVKIYRDELISRITDEFQVLEN